MESALDVLSRAATMVQDNANEARLTTKELPTTKWRRDRRLRAGEYHHAQATSSSSSMSAVASSSTATPPGTPPLPLSGSVPTALPPPPPSIHAHHTLTAAHSAHPHNMNESMMMAAAAAAMRPLCESTNRPTPTPSAGSSSSVAAATMHAHHLHSNMESPIDMSVTSTTMKHRSSPPPPYREPLPGSTYATSLARPSVITQAPPKRELSRDNTLISNRENDNRSTESISMCETVIDEHFRRSLGPDYAALFGKKSPASTPALNLTPSPQPPPAMAMAMNTPTATPTPPPPQHFQHHPTSSPYYALPHPQALISPKPTSVLLSPAAMISQVKSEPISPRLEKTMSASIMGLPPPQQQPLALQRCNSPQSPLAATTGNSTANNSVSVTVASTTLELIQQQHRLPAKNISSVSTSATPPPLPLAAPPLHLQRASPVELHSTTYSPSPSPRHSPATAATSNAVLVSSSTTSSVSTTAAASSTNNAAPASVPAIMRIKTEPGLSASNTPPASPNSSSNASISTNSDVMASVDDHFAKALGDTWKKLQESKEVRK